MHVEHTNTMETPNRRDLGVAGTLSDEAFQAFEALDIRGLVVARDSASVVRPTLLYTHSEAVIPAKAGIQPSKTGFRVKPGMTIKVKGLSTHYTRW